ncbi:hypothetical protein KIPB_009436 [Kipferlia bialata]|uniref:Uncharacterized protein n=1 Tax=Kipferlia bialata TaxID=797122 RepID=A0A9K3GLK7_9EUKA|nr:hypothetical protein KIPB_009436 [Kipferlia bialata]|eukprot:g9436.t1
MSTVCATDPATVYDVDLRRGLNSYTHGVTYYAKNRMEMWKRIRSKVKANSNDTDANIAFASEYLLPLVRSLCSRPVDIPFSLAGQTLAEAYSKATHPSPSLSVSRVQDTLATLKEFSSHKILTRLEESSVLEDVLCMCARATFCSWDGVDMCYSLHCLVERQSSSPMSAQTQTLLQMAREGRESATRWDHLRMIASGVRAGAGVHVPEVYAAPQGVSLLDAMMGQTGTDTDSAAQGDMVMDTSFPFVSMQEEAQTETETVSKGGKQGRRQGRKQCKRGQGKGKNKGRRRR